jgi:hypothetical protein
MAKSVADSVLDAALNSIKNATGLTAILCSAQPTTRTEAVTTYALADVAVASGDVTVANGDTSGRKATIAAKSAVAVDTTGTGNHLALVSSTELLYVTTTASQGVSSGGTVDIGSWKIEIADPT